MRFPGEQREFFLQTWNSFQTTGAIAPSSPALARALCRPYPQALNSVRVLEVGPGTGAVTRQLARLLRPADRLDLVESNPRFVDWLRRSFALDPGLAQIADRTRMHCMPIQDFQSDRQYDLIISALPLTNFPASQVTEIFQRLFRLLAAGGVLTYLEYMHLRNLKRWLSGGERRKRLERLHAVLEGVLARHATGRESVVWNLPPAWVHRLTHEPLPGQ